MSSYAVARGRAVRLLLIVCALGCLTFTGLALASIGSGTADPPKLQDIPEACPPNSVAVHGSCIAPLTSFERNMMNHILGHGPAGSMVVAQASCGGNMPTICNGNCTNTQVDPNNCGACGEQCQSSETCSSGSCQCGGGTRYCSNTCVDVNTDPNNCGGCGVACTSGQICTGGLCASGSRGAAMTVTGSAFSTTGPVGGAFSPTSVMYTVTAASGTVNWELGSVPNWLTPSATSGTAGTGGTVVTFTVNGTANDIGAGQINEGIGFINQSEGTGSTTFNAQLNVAAPPTITAVAPTSGAPGTSVTISGTNFTGTSTVNFGATAASSFSVNNATSITAASPAGSGTVDVTVTNPAGTSPTSAADEFTYTPPVVTAIAPSNGPIQGGISVTITGMYFTGVTAVQFGSTAATGFTVNSNTQITATAPAGSGTVDVTVSVPAATSATGPADQFTYIPAPTVTAVTPSSGSTGGGTSVTIAGTNFVGVSAVKFGAATATNVNVLGASSVTATSPAGTGIVDVTVATASGTSPNHAADGFSYVVPPAVTSIAPTSGPAAGATTVTVTGVNFTGATAVKFGGNSAIWFNVEGATTILAKSPAGTGTVDVMVTTPGGTSPTGAADRFTYEAPAARTWVSAVSGNDNNPCTVTSPCLTFAAALAKTTAGGEIDVLTLGDYGPVTITKAISIYDDGVGTAGALTTSGTSGITINAGSGDAVNLRGLSFNGLTASGASGVVFNSGAQLHIEKCAFEGFANAGITFAPASGSAATAAMVVEDATLIGNTLGMSIKPTGGIAANVSLLRIRLDKNISGGLNVDGTGGGAAINAALADSSASLNSGNGITAIGGPNGVTLNVSNVVAASNGAVGIQSSQSDGGTATVTVGKSTVYGNAVGVQSVDGGALLSYANTQLTGNASNGSFTGTTSLQ
jgi:hypothetical protein